MATGRRAAREPRCRAWEHAVARSCAPPPAVSLPPVDLLQERLRTGLPRPTAARLVPIDPAYLGRIERGERRPSVFVLWRLASIYGLHDLARALAPLTVDHSS